MQDCHWAVSPLLVLRLPTNDRCWRIVHTLDDTPSLWEKAGELVRSHGLAVWTKTSTYLGVAPHQRVIAVTEGQSSLAASLFIFPEVQMTAEKRTLLQAELISECFSEPGYEQTELKVTPLPSSHVQNPTLPLEKVVHPKPCVASRDPNGHSLLQWTRRRRGINVSRSHVHAKRHS